ncbi:uncharacterized protein [Montipora capricornis]|uniref:uncharacterized protein n=1 Tax=Montipora capricornis TaxID=246305 RepID=UPI0035F1E4A9
MEQAFHGDFQVLYSVTMKRAKSKQRSQSPNSCLCKVKIYSPRCVRRYLSPDRWLNFTDKAVCFGGHYKFAAVVSPFEGFLSSIKLTHVRGHVICDDGAPKYNSRWGCSRNHPSLGKSPFNIVVTAGRNNDILYPRVLPTKELMEGQSSRAEGTSSRTGNRLENTKMAKRCLDEKQDGDDTEDTTDNVSEHLSRVSQNVKSSIFPNEKCKMASDSHQMRHKEDDRRREIDSMPMSQRFFQREQAIESFESNDSQPLGVETLSHKPDNEGTEKNDTPSTHMRDSAAKPAWALAGGEPNVRGSRWRRAMAVRENGKRSKKIRDFADVYEEYDLMIKNLKIYGVL